jgi:hypothetical protein
MFLDQRSFATDSEERPRGTAATYTFPVAATGQLQAIKVTNTGPNSFMLSFFGTLIIPDDRDE